MSVEQKRLLAKANPELLIKHGRLADEQWQEVWELSSNANPTRFTKLLNSNLTITTH